MATQDRVSAGALTTAIYLIQVETGERRQLTIPPSTAIGDGNPAFSPDGRTLAFTRYFGPSTADVYVVALTADQKVSGEVKRLTFDTRQVSCLDWTVDGSVIFASNRDGRSHLWRIAPTGGPPERLAADAEDVSGISVARHTNGGSRLVYAKTKVDPNIWHISANDDQPAVQFISSTDDDYHPQYSPDGSRIAFGSRRSGSEEIWVVNSDASSPVQLTSFKALATGCPRWSPDGKWLAFDSRADAGHADIYIIDSQGGSPHWLTTSSADEVRPEPVQGWTIGVLFHQSVGKMGGGEDGSGRRCGDADNAKRRPRGI